MAEDMILDGGIMIATAAPAVPQIVYLDFDGELTSYNGEILSIDHVAVEDSGLNTEDISAIADKLNEDFADRGVIFVTERPADGEFSTIYIGKTSAFEKYGNFAGLAETIDAENLNKSDNAFVMLKGNESATAIADTIAHEVEHIVFGMTHTGSDLAAYAEGGEVYYYYSNNHTLSGASNCWITLSHYSSNRTYVSSSYQFDGGDDYVCLGSRYDSASHVTINPGEMHVEDGGVANNTTVNSSGFMYIISGGVANNTTVNSGGYMHIYSGGSATEIVENGGYVDVVEGANVTFASNTISGCLALWLMTVHSNTVANSTTVNAGYMYIFSGGVANSTTVNFRGSMCISRGGVANDTTVNVGGGMFISSGGVANSTTMSGGGMYISSGGVANSTVVNSGGWMWIISGVANSTTVNSGGSMRISSGGVANSTTVNSGGWMVIYSDGVANSTTVNSVGAVWVSSGGVANDTTLNSGGSMGIDGGVANSTTLNSGGYMWIYSGGVANSTTVNSSGWMWIISGGSATEIVENGGFVDVAEGANVTFASNTISGLTLSGRGMTVHSNTVANSTTVNAGGYMWIYSGGVANSTTLNSGGSMRISSGGVANSTTLNSGGSMRISSGGVANSTTVNSGGSMSISSGGVANSTTVSGGRMRISSGGSATEIVENGGRVDVAGGANVTFASNTISGLTLYGREMTVHSNTVANSTTVNSMGFMYISSGGVANSTTVNDLGRMYIYSGGSHTGRLQISGGIVSAFLGAVIDFNIADHQEADEPLINDWTRIVGHDIVTYCITVSDKQAAGEYQLVGNAANFAKTITVCAEDGSQHGELSLTMEEPLEFGKISLLLKLNEETNIVSVVVNSDFSSGTDRENKNTQVSLPESAFNGMTCKDYTLEQAPDWLTIDPNTGKLSGTTGKITDTATGYGTTEVVITGTKDGEEKKHTIELVVVPENIAGDGKVEESVKSNMTDLIAEAVENREERSSDPNLLAWMPFPQDKKFAWNYCGLDIELSGAAYGIAVTDNDYVISVQGKLSFTIFDSGKSVDERASLTVDFTGDKYIKVTTPKDFESVEFDIVGEMVFKNLALSDGFFLKEGVISVDTEKDIWSGTAEIDFVYFDKTIEAEYKVVEKQVDTLTIEVSGLDIAVGTTGFFIESIGGGVENLSDGDDEPSTIVAQMGLYYGKQVTIAGKTYSLITADLEVEVTNKSITGSGDIEVLGGIISGNVGVTVDWQEASFSAQGSTTLANLATVQGAMKIDCRGNITYSASSILDFSQYGLGVSSSANILLNFSNDGDYSNDYYAAWSSREFCGMQQSFGLRFNLDGSWELLGTQSVKAIEQNSPATYSLLRSVPPVTQSWDFTGVNGTVLISVQWKSGETEFMLTDGSGNTYTLEDIRQRSDMEIIENAGNANSLLIAVKDPADGIWTMSAANGTDTVISANVLTGNAVAATPQITVSAGENRNITVNWSCSEIPENAELCIYYDSDNSGNDGILIAQITPETAAGSLNWTVPDVISGNLYFYAVLSSPELLPAVSEYTDSIAMQSKAQLVEVDSDGWTYVAEGFYAQDAVITAGGILEIDGGALSGQNFIAKNSEIILDGATVSGSISIAGSMAVKSGIDASNLEITLDLTNRSLNDDYLIDNIALLEGISDCSLLVSPELAFGEYKLSEESDGFTGSFTIGDGKKVYGNIAADGDDLVYNDVSYQLKNNNGDLVLSISLSPYRNLTGNANGISWNTTVIGANHIIEYSSDNFTNSMRLHTSNNQIDTWGLPSETWQWRIKENNADNWTTGPEIVQNIHYTPNKFVSDKDGDMDVFFANASGTWDHNYVAQHLGILNSWSGTNEQVILTDKNKLADIFEGSSDANILLLTDDANGDALFVDDIYADSFEGIAKTQARIANLDEIRAGAGDDVVDMTSQRFAYVGDGVTVYGGDGNDVIWSNKGDNQLFGDAGNDNIIGASGNDVIVGGAGDDTLHGGGGDDIFCFGSDWGIDTVEQLSGGTVTLWFEDGSEENWNSDTRTYSDGENTVTVSGTADVTLKFGGDVSSLPEGIFSNAVTKKIFESTLA